MKTSETHTLRIDAVDTGANCGKIGITFAPGKHDFGAASGPWARDLAADLDTIVAWPARTLVTLIEPHEFGLLGIPRLLAKKRGAAGSNGCTCRSAMSARRTAPSRRRGRRTAKRCVVDSRSAKTLSFIAAAGSAARA